MLQRNQYSVGLGVEIPPPKEFVRIYFIQKGLNEEQADYFYLKHELIGWSDSKGNPIRNWKTLASEWIWMMKQN
jgi:hypothetical protein